MNEEIRTTTAHEITTKKIEDGFGYDGKMENFVGAGELTVTITLHEYRRLLQKEAEAERSATQSENWKLQNKVNELTKEVSHLKETLKMFGQQDEVEE